MNQWSVSIVKGDEQAIYNEFVVLGQLMHDASPDPSINLETHVFKENEALLYMPVYIKATGLYSGIKKNWRALLYMEMIINGFIPMNIQEKVVPYCIVL